MELTSKHLREKLIKMATIVETLLKGVPDSSFSYQECYKIEGQINKYHTEIDDDCFKYLALKNPTASDLRLTLAVMKINGELERIGDQGINMKRTYMELDRSYPKLESISETVIQSLSNAINAFTYPNVKLAIDIIKKDKYINNLHRDIMKHFISLIKNNELSFEEGFNVIKISKNLERVGDLSTNISEAVIFMVSGADIRHGNERVNI